MDPFIPRYVAFYRYQDHDPQREILSAGVKPGDVLPLLSVSDSRSCISCVLRNISPGAGVTGPLQDALNRIEELDHLEALEIFIRHCVATVDIAERLVRRSCIHMTGRCIP